MPLLVEQLLLFAMTKIHRFGTVSSMTKARQARHFRWVLSSLSLAVFIVASVLTWFMYLRLPSSVTDETLVGWCCLKESGRCISTEAERCVSAGGYSFMMNEAVCNAECASFLAPDAGKRTP